MSTPHHSPAAQALLEERARKNIERGGRIPRRARESATRLSSVQQMLWLSTQFDKTSTAYNRCSAMRLVGDLNRDALGRALGEIVRRHPILCSRIDEGDEAPEIRFVDRNTVPLPVTDLTTLPEDLRATRVRALLDEEARTPFDLDRGPLFRAGLYMEDSLTNTLFLSTHHIASDGWSDSVMLKELHTIYGALVDGRENPLPDPEIDYVDFVAWQHDRIHGITGARNAEYWRSALEGAPAVQELPLDRPRPQYARMDGGEECISITSELARSVESLAMEEEATAAMTMLAAFVLLQSRITGQLDTIVGLSLAGRTHADVEDMIGLFNTVLPLRVFVDRGMSFRSLIQRVRAASLEALEHQEVSVDAVLAANPSSHHMRHAEIAQTVFNFRNMPAFEPALPGLDVTPIETFNGSSVADLELEVLEDSRGWKCALRFRNDVFDRTTAKRLLGHYVTLLESIVTAPDETCGKLSLLTNAERHQLMVEFQGRRRDFGPVRHIHELLTAQSRKTPESTAVSYDDESVSYRDLDSRSNALAHELIERGVTPGSLVGVCMDRSPAMIVALFAILKSGAAFVPFDAEYPLDRLAHMLRDTNPVILLADSHGASLLAARGTEILEIDSAFLSRMSAVESQPDVVTADDAAACVLYTSGSTGLPKGVLSTHRGIVNNLRAMQELYSLAPDDCMLQQTSLGFDAAAWEIFWPLSVGARTYLARPGGQRDAQYVADVIAGERIVTVGFAPSMLKVMLEIPGFTGNNDIKRVMSYGEVLSPQLSELLFARMPHAELHNLYGPTETSVAVTTWQCERESKRRTVPIGRPVANAEVYILDSGLEPSPIGVHGEVLIGGVCVSNGYHDRPELTAERFLPHPFKTANGERVYRTGDIARFGADGVIEYIGRRDHQLKIRGIRVELEEIEASLESLPGVTESVVVHDTDNDGEPLLTAYVSFEGDPLTPVQIRRSLETRLPSQFLPARIAVVDELPHGPNGKVDRARLPRYSESQPRDSSHDGTPLTDLEQRVSMIWKDLLKIEHAGVSDSFFDLGGHSLLAVRMLQRIEAETQEQVSLRDFYKEPTIRGISHIVASDSPSMHGHASPPLLRIREGTKGHPPLFYLNGQPAGGGKYARRFADYLPADEGLYLLSVPIITRPATVEAMAESMIATIKAHQPDGPYVLGGNCFGAALAFEIAHQLRIRGDAASQVVMVHPYARVPMHLGYRAVRRLALLGGLSEEVHDGKFSGATDYIMKMARAVWNHQRKSSSKERIDRLKSVAGWTGEFVRKHARRPLVTWASWRTRMPREADEWVQEETRPALEYVRKSDPAAEKRAEDEIEAHARYMWDAWIQYKPKPYDGRVAIVWPVEGPSNPPWRPPSVWSRVAPRVEWHFVPGNHWSVLHEHFDHTARAVARAVATGRAS